jgi:hypothetical protein
MAERQRPQRFSFGPVLATGFWAFALLLLFVFVGTLPEAPQGMLPLLITSAVVQIVSPWQQPPPPITKRMRLRYT